ncbi:penicillin-binding protein 2 [Rhodobacterales bacterium HKCCE2091]|nr:penicillin-binding protein 2 [Rhodobacterales bacterium HKCCE2091]
MSSVRTPLRPLPRILRARERGENPDAIERENLARRHEGERDRLRQRAESRLLMLALCFFAAFLTVGMRMSSLAATEPAEPVTASGGAHIQSARADIVDRNGRVLATNLTTHALYAHPHDLVDPAAAARGLAGIFPDLDEAELLEDFTGSRRFIWIRRNLSPEQEQAVHDLGEPGLLLGPREMRLYPNGALAAHVLGGARFGQEGVDAAEIIGVAGTEAEFDDFLRDPAREGEPLRLSLDLTIQAAVEEVLAGGMALMDSVGASAVLMDARTGEIVALASLPDFDPNARPRPLTEGRAEDSPVFNRALQGVYELGSVYKTFTIAQALDLGLVGPETVIDTTEPYRLSGFSIGDFHYYGPTQTVHDVLVNSSNVGTARIAAMIGIERQRDFLGRLGLFEPTGLELVEASGAAPILPWQWRELEAATISYGHGLAISQVHLAAAYASLTNGGTLVEPTLVATDEVQAGERIISPLTSQAIRGMLRDVVAEGTASIADVPGYEVGGKTGSADIPRPEGGYYEDRTRATFAGIFPASEPRYVLVVTLEEPSVVALRETRRTAGWTAVPVARELIRRVAPLLGMPPEIETAGDYRVSGGSN